MGIESFQGSHYEVGRVIGIRFRNRIQQTLKNYTFLHDSLLPYHTTRKGQARYNRLRELHRNRFPGYFAEIHGLADGAQAPFDQLLLINLRGEYRGYITELETFGCSTVALVNDDAALLGHNEDGSPTFLGDTYLIQVEISGKIPFTAFCYPGFLPGNAFGVNTAGIFFSINNVNPVNIHEGAGRHFIARSLFEARTIQEAVQLATTPERASGFHYNIGSVDERRIVSLEVAPQHEHLREVEGLGFHTNHYLHLPKVNQITSPSSAARQQRGEVLLQAQPLSNAGDILALLRDKEHPDYPICRNGTAPDNTATLATALFEIDAKKLTVYPPGEGNSEAPMVVSM